MEEGTVDGKEMFVTDQQAAELTEPGVGSFDDPAALISSEFSSVFVAPMFAIVAIRRDEVDTALCEPLA